MVDGSRGKIRLEIVPWLTQQFGQRGSSRLILEEDLDEEMSLGEFLSSLAQKYPAVGQAIVDLEAGQLFEHVSIVHNDTVLGSNVALEEPLKAGDSLIFLPAYTGG